MGTYNTLFWLWERVAPWYVSTFDSSSATLQQILHPLVPFKVPLMVCNYPFLPSLTTSDSTAKAPAIHSCPFLSPSNWQLLLPINLQHLCPGPQGGAGEVKLFDGPWKNF
jgi:hypothetical protein